MARLSHCGVCRAVPPLRPLAVLVSAVLPRRRAADTDAADSGTLEEVVVTAQKGLENLQDVPISIEVLDAPRARQAPYDLDDYVEYSPASPTITRRQGGNGVGTSHIYMRGITAAQRNHSGSQPTVGTYLDEQPVTTIDGSLDVISMTSPARSSRGPARHPVRREFRGGTHRIITNKPDPSKFSAGESTWKATTSTHGLEARDGKSRGVRQHTA